MKPAREKLPKKNQFTKLLQLHRSALLIHASCELAKLKVSTSNADDVVQNTSLVMWKKFGALNNPQTEFLKWGKTIVSLKALHCQRKTNRDRLLFGEELVQLLPAQEQTPENQKLPPNALLDILIGLKIALPDTTKENPQEPESFLEKAKTALIQCQCLPNLPQKDRSLLLLCAQRSGAVRQLAKQEKVSANSLYQRAKRIREKLKTCILRQMAKTKDNEENAIE